MSRVFQCEALTANGIAVGGLSQVILEPSFADVVRSTADGALGIEDVDPIGLRAAFRVRTSDVLKINQVLAAAVSTTRFFGKESGAVTARQYDLLNTLFTGFNFSVSKTADAQAEFTGLSRFTAQGTGLDGIFTVGGGAGAPALTYPSRLYRPIAPLATGATALFDPDPVGGTDGYGPLHVESVSMSLAGRVLEDYSDADAGHTAIDIADWGPLQVTVTHKDSQIPASYASDITTKLMMSGLGTLKCTLLGRAGGANKTLTCNAFRFTGATATHGADYTLWTLRGECRWKNGATVYDLNGANKLFSFT